MNRPAEHSTPRLIFAEKLKAPNQGTIRTRSPLASASWSCNPSEAGWSSTITISKCGYVVFATIERTASTTMQRDSPRTTAIEPLDGITIEISGKSDNSYRTR